MAVLKKYNLAGQEVGELSIDDSMLETAGNLQMIKDYLIALRANARRWTAQVKSKAEVKHSGQKPHPQKGTGKARQGYLGAPQYKGGGRVHGPRAKFDQHVRINKKERRAAVRHLLAEKIRENKLSVLCCDAMEAPKTKVVADFLRQRNLSGRRVLFLGEGFFDAEKDAAKMATPVEKYEPFVKSINNIPKVNFVLAPTISGYDIAINHEMVIMEPAIDEFLIMLGGEG